MEQYLGESFVENTLRGCICCGTIEDEGSKTHLRCSKCRVAWYCSKECQREHWKGTNAPANLWIL